MTDKRVNDEDWKVRSAVARQGRDNDLDILVTDENWIVRSVVVQQVRDADLVQVAHGRIYEIADVYL
jgi:hypothetical protein